MTRKDKIEGMSCNHCKATVERQIGAIEGVENVTVDLSGKTAEVEGDVAPEKVVEAIRMAGFEYVE